MADSQEEDKIEQISLDYNPWHKKDPIYMILAFKEDFE